jgi:L-fucose mutarotase
MLFGIPALVGPDLLASLRAMGHGDEIAVVDANYPAQEHARRLVRCDGHGIVAVVEAILALMPLDRGASGAIFRSSQMNDPARLGRIHHEIDALCARMSPDFPVMPLAGDALYPRVRSAHTVVATGEMSLYANVILRKGVIGTMD